MKKLSSLLCFLVFAACLVPLHAQTTKLNDLNPFDKMIVTGDVSGVDVSSSSHDQPSVLVEGAGTQQVSARIEAGVLYLKVSEATDVLVHVFNGRLKRVEGPASMEVYGAGFIGNNGNYLITRHRSHDPVSWIGTHLDLALEHCEDVDIDVDIDLDKLEDIDLEVRVDIDDHDWDWQWDWEWHWEDHRDEFRLHSQKWKEEVKDALQDVAEDLQDDLEDLKKDLKRLD